MVCCLPTSVLLVYYPRVLIVGNLYANLSLTRNRKFDLISQSGWIAFQANHNTAFRLEGCDTHGLFNVSHNKTPKLMVFREISF